MSSFAIFILMLVHSLWQAAMLLTVYVCQNILFRKAAPVYKRNTLYLLLLLQCIISMASCFVISGNESFQISTAAITGINIFIADNAALLFLIWLIVICTKLLSLTFSWVTFKDKLLHGLIKTDAAHRAFLQLKCYEFSLSKKISIWYSKEINVPLTFGFFKPIILLPFSLYNNISAEETEAIIVHELCHIKNKDYLLNIALLLLEIFYFFNPFIKIITGKIKLEREKACDVEVIQQQYNPVLYAELLIKLVKQKHKKQYFEMAATNAFHGSSLFSRIRFFSDHQNFSFQRHGWMKIMPVMTTGLIVLITAVTLQNSSSSFHFFSGTGSSFFSMAAINKTTINKENNNFFVTNAGQNDEKDNLPVSTLKRKRPKTIENAKLLSAETANAFPVIQTSLNAPDSIKEFIYTVESVNGKASHVFKMTLHNGTWIMEPLFVITETYTDSLLPKIAADSIK